MFGHVYAIFSLSAYQLIKFFQPCLRSIVNSIHVRQAIYNQGHFECKAFNAFMNNSKKFCNFFLDLDAVFVAPEKDFKQKLYF